MAPINIGIAGYMGAGKSMCAEYLSQKGCTVINADMIAKDIMNNNNTIRENLAETFGNDIFHENSILFDKLSKIAFDSLNNMLKLNRIVHPHVIAQLQSKIAESRDQACIVDAALISYWHIENWFDKLLWIHASKETRFKRLTQKSSITPNELIKRIEIQGNLFSEPMEKRWIIISNETSKEKFESLIDKYKP